MGKRRSQIRQNAGLQRVGAPPSDDFEGAAGTAPVSPATANPQIRLAPSRDKGSFNASPVSRARGQVQDQVDWLEDNPLGLLLGGIALGILVGLVLPASDEETERLGDVGENIAGQVQEHVQALGHDVVEHSRAVVVDAVQATLVEGKSPVDAVQQSVQEHLATVAKNAQTRVEASLSSGQES